MGRDALEVEAVLVQLQVHLDQRQEAFAEKLSHSTEKEQREKGHQEGEVGGQCEEESLGQVLDRVSAKAKAAAPTVVGLVQRLGLVLLVEGKKASAWLEQQLEPVSRRKEEEHQEGGFQTLEEELQEGELLAEGKAFAAASLDWVHSFLLRYFSEQAFRGVLAMASMASSSLVVCVSLLQN